MGNDEELIALFKRAAEVASAVPESMREAAFHRALDALQDDAKPSPSPRPSAKRASRPALDGQPAARDPISALNDLERSRAPEVDNEAGALGKSLALLRVAEREFSIERLSAPQIAQILTEKFRWRVTRQAVTQALGNAGRLVDRRTEGRTVTYRLMQPGEDWLDTDPDSRTSAAGRRSSSTRGAPVAERRERAKKTASKKVARSAEAASRGRRTRVGPKAAVESLISSGYFSMPRTLGELQEKLRHDRALRFKPTDLSPALTRLLREGQLSREKNADGQYEYIAASA
jgi:hypothetical protein